MRRVPYPFSSLFFFLANCFWIKCIDVVAISSLWGSFFTSEIALFIWGCFCVFFSFLLTFSEKITAIFRLTYIINIWIHTKNKYMYKYIIFVRRCNVMYLYMYISINNYIYYIEIHLKCIYIHKNVYIHSCP